MWKNFEALVKHFADSEQGETNIKMYEGLL
jgi:hypothetical protein